MSGTSNGPVRKVRPGDRRAFHDVLSCSTPEGVLDEEALYLVWERRITGITKQFCWAQYDNPPYDLEFGAVEVLVTDDPDKVASFGAGDNCKSCREGTQRALEYLEQHPEVPITMVNIEVTEVW